MIQRLQTLFLILALVANGLMLNFDVFTASATDEAGKTVEQLTLRVTHLHYESSLTDSKSANETQIWLLALYGFASLMAIGAVFLYKNRSLQLKVSRFAMLLETGLLVLLFFYTDGAAEEYFRNDASQSSYQLGIFMPIISVICFFLANLFIMRDQQIVRSAERLR